MVVLSSLVLRLSFRVFSRLLIQFCFFNSIQFFHEYKTNKQREPVMTFGNVSNHEHEKAAIYTKTYA